MPDEQIPNEGGDSPDVAARPSRAVRPRPWRSAQGRLMRLCQKELRETLRDRRTIGTLLLMPLLVYPLLGLSFQRLLLTSLGGSRQIHPVIAVASQAEFDRLFPLLRHGELLLLAESSPTGIEDPAPPMADAARPGTTQRDPALASATPLEPATAAATAAAAAAQAEDAGAGTAQADAAPTDPAQAMRSLFEPAVEVSLVIRANPEGDVASGAADLGVRVRPIRASETRTAGLAAMQYELVGRDGSVLSRTALDYVQDRLHAVNAFALRRQLEVEGFAPVVPARISRRTVRGSDAAVSLTTLIPLILILMTITGAVYPAIDLSAGERERGTLEALMAAPVPRLGLLAAKYVAVVTVALLTASANLLAMAVTLKATGLGSALFGRAGLPAWVFVQMFALLILFSGFFSAVLLGLTSFARSFKEAQAYLIPVMLLSLAPGLLSLMPEVEFNAWLAVTPLVNIVLLARELFEGQVDPTLATAAVFTTGMYAVAAIAVAARVFGADAILYGSEAGWSDLFRRPPSARLVPSVSSALLCLALLFPACFLMRGLMLQPASTSLAGQLARSGLATVVLFGGFPLVATILQRLPCRATFRLRRAPPLAFVGATLLAISLWPWAHEIYLLNETLGLRALGPEQMDYAQKLLAGLGDVPLWLTLAALALAPAVCEELLFRGYLLRALLATTSGRNAILASALLFGGFHVVTIDALALGRLLPSTFLGLILGWVAWRTASVWPGMVLHAGHNGVLLTVAYYRQGLAAHGWGVQEQAHMPAAWLALATCSLVAGLCLVWTSSRRPGGHAEAGAMR